MQKTDVIFRKINQGPAKGTIVALLPHEVKDKEGNVTYIATETTKRNYYDVMEQTVSATAEEFSGLENRLVEQGYDLNIVKKINPKKWSNELAKLN